MQRQPSSIEKKIFTGFGFALLVSILVSVATYLNNQRLVDTRKKVAETQEVLRSLKQILMTVTTAETGARGYLLTGDEAFLEPFKTASGRIEPDIQRVRVATRNDAAIQPRLAQMEDLMRGKLQALHQVNEARRANGFEAARDLPALREGKAQLEAIRSVVSEIEGEQLAVLNATEAAAQRGASTNLATVLIGSFATVGVLGLVYFPTRIDMRESPDRS